MPELDLEPWAPKVRHTVEAATCLVISDDVDGLLCGVLAQKYLHIPIIGAYTGQHLLMFDGHAQDEALGALWIDNDVYDGRVASLGQHLLSVRRGTHTPSGDHSFNPNEWCGQTFEDSFTGVGGGGRDKYPFATVHMLIRALDIPIPAPESLAFAAIAHADSAWASYVTYPANAKSWRDLMYGNDPVIQYIASDEYVASPGTLAMHTQVVADLVEMGINKRSSQTRSREAVPDLWRGLLGHQGFTPSPIRYPEKFLSAFGKVLGYLGSLFDFDIWQPQQVTSTSGNRRSLDPLGLRDMDLPEFLRVHRVFSYAITGQRELQFTDGLFGQGLGNVPLN